VFNMRVLLLKLLGLSVLHLRGSDPRFVDAGGFIHELSGTVNGLVIGGLVISLGGLSDGESIQNVELLTLVNKEPVVALVNL
jgi:hypothetical protein